MCGRYSITPREEAIEARFKAKFAEGTRLKKRWNAAPGEDLPIIANTHPDQIQLFRWGLVPGWAKEPSIGYKTINARVETLTEKPSFQFAFQKQRCLVLADGYYEWKTIGKDKIPHWLHLPEKALFAMAGLWEHWAGPSGKSLTEPEKSLYSFTVITLPAAPRLAHIHERTPAILTPEQESKWLDPASSESDLFDLLRPPATSPLQFYTVSKKVNSAMEEGPELVKPFSHPIQGSLF